MKKIIAPCEKDYLSVLSGLPKTSSKNDINTVCICTCVHCTIKVTPRIKTTGR
jgi:hypothetical protein